ncbi:hypothetical protein BSLG_008922 [Batrachochytrium salamandrivorans]|nr:hypothetical protein BSLG_008922 [Batrachochytrium salamandrivorans]
MVGSVLSLTRLSSASWKQKWPLISTTSSPHARSGLSHCTTALSGSGGTCNSLVFMHTFSYSSPAIGWIVQNHQIQAALAELIQRTPAITLFNSSAVTSISNDNPSCFPSVVLGSGDRFSCQLLIGADGGNSKLSSTKSSMVWSTTPAIAAKLLKLSDEDFVELVNAALHNPALDVEFALNQILPDGSVSSEVDLKSEIEWGRLRGAAVGSGQGSPHRVVRVQPKSRAAFPLRLRNSTAYTGRRVALIGDAAHTIHPLAGQGLNLGLADAQALSKAIVDAAKHGGDWDLM